MLIWTKTTRFAAAPALLCVLLSGLLACSSPSKGDGTGGSGTGGSSGVGGGCEAYEVPAGTDLTTPTVSLQNDVMPIFNGNCGSMMCHGGEGAPGVLFLGAESAAGSDFSTVRMGLVGVFAMELPKMPYVTADAPVTSYLMHKLDGDQCQYDSSCAGGSCLADMPNGGATLPVATRDTVRRWIAQGALDN
jgi:hypothetical protein